MRGVRRESIQPDLVLKTVANKLISKVGAMAVKDKQLLLSNLPLPCILVKVLDVVKRKLIIRVARL